MHQPNSKNKLIHPDREEPVSVARSHPSAEDAGVAEAAGGEAQHAAALSRRQADRGCGGVGLGQPPIRVVTLQRTGETDNQRHIYAEYLR